MPSNSLSDLVGKPQSHPFQEGLGHLNQGLWKDVVRIFGWLCCHEVSPNSSPNPCLVRFTTCLPPPVSLYLFLPPQLLCKPRGVWGVLQEEMPFGCNLIQNPSFPLIPSSHQGFVQTMQQILSNSPKFTQGATGSISYLVWIDLIDPASLQWKAELET